ncbi:MAG: aminotransferase class I/II-fold pyridoxal phosphate-dependent enzyme [Eubacteriales bacterium]|nr:aminotransferase class I/II-fold pyridoxal phosphate-dependent enzyme [Eubacteriales bacterium]
MNRLNHTVEATPPSGIRKFFDVVSDMEGAISLGVGEPDFVTPWNIREAAIYCLEKGGTHYTSNWGTKELREAIAQYMAQRFHLSYHPYSQVLVTVGASEGIDLALRAIINPGEEVLLPEPSYVSYAPGIQFAGGVPVGIKTNMDKQFRIEPDDVLPLITDKTKALILPYPNNPTGAVMERRHLEELATALRGRDIIVISDEIYAELTYTGTRHVSIAELDGMRDNTVVLSGFSKSFAMTGWRLGYACGPKDIIESMFKIHQYTMLCAPIMSQAGAYEGLRHGLENGFADVEKMRREYNRRRRYLVKAFNDMGLTCFEPLGAFYTFPSIRATGLGSEEFCEALLREEKVAVVPGTAFGPSGEGHVRCSYAYSLDEIKRALERMERFVARRKRG